MPFNNEDKVLLEEFFSLKEQREFKKCLSILGKLKPKYKNSSVLYGLLGTVYYELKDYKKSLQNFRKTVKLKPKSELASLGIFHCLIDLGKDRLALNEMRRFLDGSKAELYKLTIRELYQNIERFQSDHDKKMITDMYSRIWKKNRSNLAVFRYPLNKSK